MQLRRGVHFTNQLFYSPQAQVNFVDLSLFDDLEWDMTLAQELRLMKVFGALKQNWLDSTRKRNSSSSDSESKVEVVVEEPGSRVKRSNSLLMIRVAGDKPQRYSGEDHQVVPASNKRQIVPASVILDNANAVV